MRLNHTDERILCPCILIHFFFNDTATTEIYTLSLHDALPILSRIASRPCGTRIRSSCSTSRPSSSTRIRSEEHTSELQSLAYLVCRLLLVKKNIELSTRSSTVGSHG